MAENNQAHSQQNILQLFHSGQPDQACQAAEDFLTAAPTSLTALFLAAVIPGHTSANYLKIAQDRIHALYHHPERSTWSAKFLNSVRNEYYWFFELYQKQYELGIELNHETMGSGHYSACVGASMLAYKAVQRSNLDTAAEWSLIAIEYFQAFERLSPTFGPINYFAAQAYACKGMYDKALAIFKKTYVKQQLPEQADEISDFQAFINEIREMREPTEAPTFEQSSSAPGH